MPDPRLQRYISFFEKLDPDNIDQLVLVMTEDVHFVDPFNDVRGLAPVEKIFQHMFISLQEPKFTVTHAATNADSESSALIRWQMNSLLNDKPYNIVGMSVITFAADGRVSSHIDHWDAAQQFYERLPVIGWVLKIIRARLSV